MKIYIYCLKDAKSVFYIGQTKNVKRRLKCHLSGSRLLKNDKDAKIRGMMAKGKNPILEIIATCDESKANEMEAKYILEHAANGSPLLNSVITRAKRITDFSNKRLSVAEIEVLKLMAADMATQLISEETGKSIRTIETIRQSIRNKLTAATLPGIIFKAVKAGYLTTPL